MIIEEARHLEILPLVIDVKDDDNMTPLYLLSERGYRTVSDVQKDPDEVERLAVEKLLEEIKSQESNKNKGLDEDEAGVEADEQEMGSTSIEIQILRNFSDIIEHVKLYKSRHSMDPVTGVEKPVSYTLYLIRKPLPAEMDPPDWPVVKAEIREQIKDEMKA